MIFRVPGIQSHTAHILGSQRIFYRYHPLHGREVTVLRRRDGFGSAEVLIRLSDQSICALPAWMLDEVFCCQELQDQASPRIGVAGLRGLRALLDQVQPLPQTLVDENPPSSKATEKPKQPQPTLALSSPPATGTNGPSTLEANGVRPALGRTSRRGGRDFQNKSGGRP